MHCTQCGQIRPDNYSMGGDQIPPLPNREYITSNIKTRHFDIFASTWIGVSLSLYIYVYISIHRKWKDKCKEPSQKPMRLTFKNNCVWNMHCPLEVSDGVEQLAVVNMSMVFAYELTYIFLRRVIHIYIHTCIYS